MRRLEVTRNGGKGKERGEERKGKWRGREKREGKGRTGEARTEKKKGKKKITPIYMYLKDTPWRIFLQVNIS
jgi:hypothetical protein